jgi:hypothetical protein
MYGHVHVNMNFGIYKVCMGWSRSGVKDGADPDRGIDGLRYVTYDNVTGS